MMKLLILIWASLIPYSLYSLMTLLLIIASLLSLFCSHYMEYFKFYNLFAWDSLSFSLVSLTLVIAVFMLLASMNNSNIMNFSEMFHLVSMALVMFLVLSFSVSNMLLFYVCFESSLIPIFVMILGWGNQPERFQAAMYMLIYTVVSSLPLLTSLMILTKLNSSNSLFLLTLSFKNNLSSSTLALMLILAFSVKLPIYFLHLWLPKAHVEAPVAGSMMLAAVLLKLGGYGLIRFSSKIHSIYYYISPLLISWSLVGGVVAALTCLFQTDIKFLIALSSVAHMSMVMASVMTFSSWGVNSAQFIMIGHGFCSSGLFFIANTLYERFNSRSLFLLKGTQTILPSFSVVWFLLAISNMSAPPTLNLIGEMEGISSLFAWSNSLILTLMLLVFLTATFSLFLYSHTQHGKLSSLYTFADSISTKDWLISLMHWVPLNILFLALWTLQLSF